MVSQPGKLIQCLEGDFTWLTAITVHINMYTLDTPKHDSLLF